MTELGQANPYFVRCIKPNGEKVKDKFVPQMVLNQLKYSGMMETVRIRRSGYPVRRLFSDFMFRYEVLGRSLGLEGKDEVESCRLIMNSQDNSRKDWQIGKTKVSTRLVIVMWLVSWSGECHVTMHALHDVTRSLCVYHVMSWQFTLCVLLSLLHVTTEWLTYTQWSLTHYKCSFIFLCCFIFS